MQTLRMSARPRPRQDSIKPGKGGELNFAGRASLAICCLAKPLSMGPSLEAPAPMARRDFNVSAKPCPDLPPLIKAHGRKRTCKDENGRRRPTGRFGLSLHLARNRLDAPRSLRRKTLETSQFILICGQGTRAAGFVSPGLLRAHAAQVAKTGAFGSIDV